ncbi:yfeABCD locus regulator [Vibrio parahaemolyticus]|nr:yfeABCD locus regulator [Vibrio parahaemolyticus]
MNYKEALNKSRVKRVLGVIIAMLALCSVAISLLKFLYWGLDDGSKLGSALSEPVKRIISIIYENTQFLNVLWNYSPIPNHLDLINIDNLYFFLTYAVLFVGVALKASGDKLAKRLAKIHEQIEDQLIKESMSGNTARSRKEIEDSVEIPNTSIFTQFQQLYIAPIVTAVVAGILLKLAGF